VRQSFYPGEAHPDVYKWDYPATGGVNLNVENHALGTNENTSPAKVQTNTSTTSDPRFGEMLKYESARDIKYPSNKTLSVRSLREATLADASDPFSVQTSKNDLTLNALSAGSVSFDRATSTMTTTSAKGRVQKVKLDAFERPISQQIATFTPVTYAYDTRGRLWKTTEGTRVTTLTYNTKGFVATITNPASEKTAFTYNAAGQVLTQTLPDTRVITYGYDTAGNRTSVTPPGKPAHGFLYNLLQEVISYIAPDIVGAQRTTTYAYDNDRALKQITRPNGTILTLTYHPTSGLLKTIESGSAALKFDYQDSLLLTASSPDGYTSTYSYDGDLVHTISTPRLGDLTLDYSGPYMKLTSMQVNGLTPTTLHYDDDGLIDIAGAETLTRNLTTGLVSSTTLNKVKETFTYSSFGETKTYKATVGTTVLLSETYTRDNLGRIKTRAISSKSAPTLETLTYTYDNSGRLKSVSSDLNGATVYTYDSNSNRFTVTRAGQTVTAAYDDQDRLLSSGNKTFAYNDNGELIKQVTTAGATSTTVTYTYDVFGNLKTAILSPTKTVSYEYDASNRRVARLVNGVVKERYLYLTQTQIAAVFDGSGNVLSTFVYGEKQTPEYMVKAGVTYKFITDPIGSVRMVVNSATGAIAQELTYDEFGRVLTDSKPGFQPLGFAGGLYDVDTKFVQFGARDYDAETGMWLSKDPIMFAGGDTNLYGYVLQDPVNWVDPAGLARCTYSISSGNLSCSSNDGGPAIKSKMFSGFRSAANNPSMTTRYGGPVPTGTYELRKVSSSGPRDWFMDPGLISRAMYKMGFGRGAFNLHLRKGGSAGCITGSASESDSAFQRIDNLLNAEDSNNSIEVFQ
jgi:RHS repeat-associated protein